MSTSKKPTKNLDDLQAGHRTIKVTGDEKEDEFDFVLMDTPPAGVVVDALEIAKYCDGALVVVFPDGHREAVSSGEVSIRGMYGYL